MDNNNEWARRRAQVALVERWARIAGNLLDAGAGAVEKCVPVADLQAYEGEIQALNQHLEMAIRGIRETFAGLMRIERLGYDDRIDRV